MADIISGPLTTEGIDDYVAPAASAESELPPETRRAKIIKNLGWSAFGFSLLILFTLLKLPDERIKAYVQGMIGSALAPKGILFSAEKGYISFGFGLSYVMKGVTLSFPPPLPPAKIDKISVTPDILPMIMGYQGGSLSLNNGDGKLSASFSMKGSQVSLSFDANQVDIAKLGVLAFVGPAGIRGSGIVSGKGSVSGDTSVPSTLNGDIEVKLSKINLDAQTIYFFNVPKVTISEGKIDLSADKGKALIKSVSLGKPGSTDDLQGTATGDIILGRNWDSSTLNAKINLKLSDTLLKAFILIDSFLGPGKQGDGSYSLNLSGPVTAPNPIPIPAGGH